MSAFSGKGRSPVRSSNALRRLEYRGYDSAGIATLEDGHLARRRAAGKLKNLEARACAKQPLQGSAGIGHTRWATHGKPTETNAHPHADGRLAVVHNGIIENFRELREELRAKGHVFESDTDTEVVAHLISEAMAGACRLPMRWPLACRASKALLRSPACSTAKTIF